MGQHYYWRLGNLLILRAAVLVELGSVRPKIPHLSWPLYARAPQRTIFIIQRSALFFASLSFKIR